MRMHHLWLTPAATAAGASKGSGMVGSRSTRIGLRAGAVLGCTALLAACGSSSSSSSSSGSSGGSSSGSSASSAAGVTAAKNAVAGVTGASKFIAPGPAFNAAKAKGKTIALLPDYSSLPFTQEINVGLYAAAKAAGVNVTNCPNAGTTAAWVACFNQEIAAKPAAIVLDGSPDPSQLQPQIEAANKAGIPVLANHVPLASQFPAGTVPATGTKGLAGVEAGPFPAASKIMADYPIAQTGGKVHALIITAQAPASDGMVKMIQQELAKNCPSCTNTVINVPITDWATKLQAQTQTALLKDPTINWVIPLYDGADEYVVPGIQGSGRASKISLISYNGQGAALTYISQGKVAATVGEDLAWTGWDTMDRVLRILALGKDNHTVAVATPVRLWTKANISQAGTPPKPTVGYSSTFENDYLKLWGLSK
jgi:ribose transport system substrate-binding protein